AGPGVLEVERPRAAQRELPRRTDLELDSFVLPLSGDALDEADAEAHEGAPHRARVAGVERTDDARDPLGERADQQRALRDRLVGRDAQRPAHAAPGARRDD